MVSTGLKPFKEKHITSDINIHHFKFRFTEYILNMLNYLPKNDMSKRYNPKQVMYQSITMIHKNWMQEIENE